MYGVRCSRSELPPREHVHRRGGMPWRARPELVTRGRAVGDTLSDVHLYEGKHPFKEDVAESGVAGVHKP
jgi:hypothetical protein